MRMARPLRRVRSDLSDQRFSPDAPLYVRVVDASRRAPNGSYHADEYPITGGMTGWEDGHASILADAPPAEPCIDAAHLERQREWSERTFGPGPRTLGVIDHIRKELVEIQCDPGDPSEWIDVVILALDGAWRAGWEPQQIIDAIKTKQATNEARQWPDWRTASADHAIEHVRTESGDSGGDR